MVGVLPTPKTPRQEVVTTIQWYVSPFGHVRANDEMKRIQKETPKTKAGDFDMRYKASKQARDYFANVDRLIRRGELCDA